MFAAIVNRDGMTDHLRDDGRTARPGLDDLLLAAVVQRIDLPQKMLVDKRTLLETTWHQLPPRTAGSPAANDHVIGLLLTITGATLWLAPR